MFTMFSRKPACRPRTSFLTDFRYEDQDVGEPTILFDPDNFPPERRSDAQNTSLRVGARHSFAPNSTSLLTYLYNDLDVEDKIPEANDQLLDGNEKLNSIEYRHAYTHDWFNADAGLGYVGGNLKQDVFLGDMQVLRDRGDTNLFNSYLYSEFKLPYDLSITAGVSFDVLDNPILEKNQINPKIGAIWQIFENTFIRAAAFRAFPRPTAARQTIEPTSVAGFNQFYDDIVGTRFKTRRSWN